MSILSYAKKDGLPAVFIGIEKNNAVHVCHLEFSENVELDLDLILASVIMRHRQVTKNVFNVSGFAARKKAAEPLEIEDLFKLDVEIILSCETQFISQGLPRNMLVFFLGSDSVWKVVGHYDILSLEVPIPVVELYKRYYALHYPKAVSEFAFADPKNIKRVYQVDQINEGEDFLFEPLFSHSDIIDHVFCPMSQVNITA